MSEKNTTMTINVPNSLYESVHTVSPFRYRIHEMVERSISTPDPETPVGLAIQLRIDEQQLAEREDKEFLGQLKEYHSRRFSDEW